MSCKDNKDGSCTVEYIPFTPGDYDVNITFGGRPIPGVHWGEQGACSAGGKLEGSRMRRKAPNQQQGQGAGRHRCQS